MTNAYDAAGRLASVTQVLALASVATSYGYDAGGWGRYTQGDPITLGSLNHPPIGMTIPEAVGLQWEMMLNPLRQHSFAYAGDSPTNRVDPDGKHRVPRCVQRTAQKAFKVSNATGLLDARMGPRDAYRHCIWSSSIVTTIADVGE